MKQSFLIILFLLLTLSGYSQQRAARDSIRAGNEAYKEKLYNAAESKYQAAFKLNPKEKMSVYNLANTYYRQSKWKEAIEEYEVYVKLEQDDNIKRSMAFHNLGNSYLKKKDLDKSMEAYKNALRNNPSDDEARYNLAVVQKMIKDRDDKKDDDNSGGGGGGQDNQDKEQDKKDQQPDQNKDDKQPPKQEGQISSENIEQILKAMEQEERATQARIRDARAKEQEQKNALNRQQDKDW